MGEEVKVVWRVTGSGAFRAEALAPDGSTLRPSWGPVAHQDSSWTRPGEEWGTAFRLPSHGCWALQVHRGEETARLELNVEDSG